MAYDEGVAARLRAFFEGRPDVVEKKMFGGLALMVRGNMLVGIVGERLMARVGASAYAHCLAQPWVHEMDFTGKPMKGYVYVAPPGFESDTGLSAWVDRCLAFNATLAAK